MKILHVGNFRIKEMTKEWALGISPSHPLHAVCELTKFGHELFFFDAESEWNNGRFGFQLALLRNLENCDLIIAHNLVEINFVALLRKIGFVRRPLIAFVHSIGPRSIQRVSAHGVDYLLSLNRKTTKQLLDIKVKRSKIVPFDFGADLEFYPYRKRVGKTVLSVGVSGRDFDTLIEAAEFVDADFVIVGKVSDLARKKAGSRISILSNGHYDLDYAKIITLYQEARVVVVAHNGTDHPYGLNALVEAMAMSRPVVLTAGSGIDIDPNEYGFGFRVPPHDPEALANAITKFVSDEGFSEECGSRARSAAETRYSSEIMADRLQSVIERIIY